MCRMVHFTQLVQVIELVVDTKVFHMCHSLSCLPYSLYGLVLI